MRAAPSITLLRSATAIAAVGGDLVGGLVGRGLGFGAAVRRDAGVVHHHPAPARGEQPRVGAPEPPAAAGDDRHLAVESQFGHCVVPRWIQTVFELWHGTPIGCKTWPHVCRPIGHAHVEARKAQLLDVAEQLFLRSGLGVSVRDITDAAGQNGAAIHYHFGSRDALVGAVIARRAGDLAARRRAALQALRARADDPDHPRRRRRASCSPTSGWSTPRGPDAQRWIDLMHALWLDRSPALAFMAEYAGRRAATGSASRAPRSRTCRSDVFDARFALAIETDHRRAPHTVGRRRVPTW